MVVSVTPTDFKDAMAEFASGVTIVTTSLAGEPYGMTVAAFASVSLEPPLVLVCIARSASSHDVLAAAGRFAVNVLAEEQAEVAWRFAGPALMAERFAGLDVEVGAGGVPLVAGSLAVVECEVAAVHPAGDHTVYVGRVERAAVRAEHGRALVLHRRAMFALGAALPAPR